MSLIQYFKGELCNNKKNTKKIKRKSLHIYFVYQITFAQLN